MNKVITHFKESYYELMNKVTWPSWAELQQSTVIVLAATIVITLLIWAMDIASENVLKFIYSLF